MLTLEFKDQTESGEFFHFDTGSIKQMHFKFVEPEKELLYMMTANPLLHKRGKIGVSSNNAFHGRSLNMDKLKEILAYSPVGILVKMFNKYFIVGKGFIAVKDNSSSRGFEHDRLEILFAVTAQVGVQVRDAHDLKIYLDRKLYEPEYKRVMTILKPYMSEHKGDILVTRSINAHLAYTFQMPVFYNARSRAEFSDLMKELFYRGIYWSSWRRTEDKRLDEEEKIAMAKEEKEKREREIQRQMLEILSAQGIIISEVVQLEESIVSNLTPIRDPELLEELRAFQPGIAETQNQPATPTPTTEPVSPLQQETAPLPIEEVRVQARQFGNAQRMREAMEEHQRIREELHQQLRVDTTRLGQTPTELTVTPMEPPQHIMLDADEFLNDPQPTPVDMAMPSDSEHVSDEEMARVLSGFSINPNANIRYSALLHPITGVPLTSYNEGGLSTEEEELARTLRTMRDEGDINQDTEIIILDSQPDAENNLDDDYDPTQEELDNDPDAYEDADVIEDIPEEEQDMTEHAYPQGSVTYSSSGVRLGWHDEG